MGRLVRAHYLYITYKITLNKFILNTTPKHKHILNWIFFDTTNYMIYRYVCVSMCVVVVHMDIHNEIYDSKKSCTHLYKIY